MMKNKFKLSPAQAMAGLTILASILGTTKETLAQNLANQKNITKTEINTSNSLSPIDFAITNVGKYYPDMVDYTKKLLNSFISKEQKDFVNKTLTELIKKYPNDKDKIKFIIGTLEWNVFMNWATFSDTYWLDPTDLDFEIDEEFNIAYDKRFSTNLANLQKEVKEMEKYIKNTKEDIKNTKEDIKKLEEKTQKHLITITTIMKNFSKEDIKNNKDLYELVKKTKNRTDTYNLTTTPHMQELYSIIK